jgi:hypothetical protein
MHQRAVPLRSLCRYTGLHEEKVRVMGERDEALSAATQLAVERDGVVREKSVVGGRGCRCGVVWAPNRNLTKRWDPFQLTSCGVV